MNKRGKLLSLIMILMIAVLSIAGCSGQSSSGSDSGKDAEASEETTEETSGTAEEPAEVQTLKVGVLGTSIKPVGVLVANANGYFEEEGVKVEFVTVSSMNDAYAAVSNGDLDVYLFSSTAAATFISQGTTTLRVFGGTAGEGSEIMAAAGSGIEISKPEDFVGKTIACQMPETGQMVLKNYLIEQGYKLGTPDEPGDVNFVFVEDGQTAVQGCVKGEYDLCITNQALGYYAEQNGVEVVALVKDFVDPYPCCRQTCNFTTYEEKNDALVRFETAALRGYEFYLNNEDATLDILEEYSGQDRDFLKGQIYGTENYTPAMRITLDPDKDACVAFYKAMETIGEIAPAEEINWSDYVVTDIYGNALAALAEREPDNQLWKDLGEYFKAHNTL